MDPRYPVGKFTADPAITPEKRKQWISQIAALPSELNAALAALPPGGLDRPYRDGGWTARQVVHHLADSHLNAYTRVRLALTEQHPRIKTYEESAWAKLPDAEHCDPASSLAILDGIHTRLNVLLESLTPDQFGRTAEHPEWGPITVDWLLQMYSWHCGITWRTSGRFSDDVSKPHLRGLSAASPSRPRRENHMDVGRACAAARAPRHPNAQKTRVGDPGPSAATRGRGFVTSGCSPEDYESV